jgi:hypothetical protein
LLPCGKVFFGGSRQDAVVGNAGCRKGDAMSNVVRLRHEESVGVDVTRLAGLAAEMGEAGAEGVVVRAMQEMASRLSHMERQYIHGNTVVISRDACRLARIAAEFGMTGMARVAGDVHRCAGRGDMVAFAATWARLLRIGDESLNTLWRMADGSG